MLNKLLSVNTNMCKFNKMLILLWDKIHYTPHNRINKKYFVNYFETVKC